MADDSASSRKRKLCSQDSVIEIIDDENYTESQPLCPDVEIVEPDAKVQHTEMVPSQNSDSNFEFSLNSQSSVELISDEPVVDVKQHLLELDDELHCLKAENEELKARSCLCGKVRADDEIVMAVLFGSDASFQTYKDRIVKALESVPELCVTEDKANFVISVLKERDITLDEWVIVDKDEVKAIKECHRKKKKKKTKMKPSLQEELFTLDTTPSITTKNNLCYESKFAVLSSANSDGRSKEQQSTPKPPAAALCFNCDQSHNLRDCPNPRDYAKINAAKLKLKSQRMKTVRYHLEEDQRYAHLRPGRISEKLQEALGLHHNQLPPHIYRMRQLGYPPGWFHEVEAGNDSELVLFDFQGKSAISRRKKAEDVDAEKIVEYPGFNVPMEKGIKDEYKIYGCPSYSKEFSKQNILAMLQQNRKKAEDNLEICDMDVDNPQSDKEVEAVKETRNQGKSPTLGELETAKRRLLAELTESSNSNTSKLDTMDQTLENGASFQTLDITGTVDEDINGLTKAENAEDACSTPSVPENIVRNSSFGTPVLKSSTPYYRLPDTRNFSQNVSQLINFENLPNSTGKYEQMVGVLQKVRRTLHNLNEPSS